MSQSRKRSARSYATVMDAMETQIDGNLSISDERSAKADRVMG